MRFSQKSIGLMLMVVTLFLTHYASAGQLHGHYHLRHHVAVRETLKFLATSASITPTSVHAFTVSGIATPCASTSCVMATAPADHSCDSAQGEFYTKEIQNTDYDIICDIDFPGQDIYPFILAGSFGECLNHCEEYNKINTDLHCTGFVFAPDRANCSDDCYLKSSLESPYPATIHLIGATSASPSRTTAPARVLPTSTIASPTSSILVQKQPVNPPDFPAVKISELLGTSINNPTNQYVKHPMDLPMKLATQVLVPGINLNLVTKYPISNDTGSWTQEHLNTLAIRLPLANMSVIPHLSRDGGKGGTIDGHHIFIFCDTATFDGDEMVDFVSSSVATDVGMHGLDGKTLNLVDHLGEWQDDVGRMRGFAPLTIGEQSFNKALSGQGYRYAVWPESSLIPLNDTHALLFASLVYDEVDMNTQEANFTTIGNSLLMVSVDPKFGPHADRIANQYFTETQVTYGSLGGLRSWGKSGVGGMDGEIYLFGEVTNGVLVAKTSPTTYTDVSSCLYWDGSTWAGQAPSPDDHTALLLDEPVMDLDVFFAPKFNTFLMIYLTPTADNTFYYRSLRPEVAIIPPYEIGGDINYAESIVRQNWSDKAVLYQASTPSMGYIYAGAVHAGYFGDDDITNGGVKALISWTEHTGEDASSADTGYAHKTTVITFA